MSFELRSKGNTVFIKPQTIDLTILDSFTPSTIMDNGVRVFLAVRDVDQFKEMVEKASAFPPTQPFTLPLESHRPTTGIDSVLYGQFYRGDDKAGIYNYSEKAFAVAGSDVQRLVSAGKLKHGLSMKLRYGLDQGVMFPKRFLRIVEADLGLE
jgi:hypothetical protein